MKFNIIILENNKSNLYFNSFKIPNISSTRLNYIFKRNGLKNKVYLYKYAYTICESKVL